MGSRDCSSNATRYNSVIYPNTAANEYVVVVANEAYLNGKIYTYHSEYDSSQWGDASSIGMLGRSLQEKMAANQLKRLENGDCIDNYRSNLQSKYSNVIVVTSLNETSLPNPSAWSFSPTPQKGSSAEKDTTASWLCGGFNIGKSCIVTPDNASDWKFAYCPPSSSQILPGIGFCTGSAQVNVTKAEYCLAEPTDAPCSVGLSMPLLITVIIMNAAKVCALIYLTFRRTFRPLVTLGDALASFLSYKDLTTENLGPVSAHEIRNRDRGLQMKLQSRQRLKAIAKVPLGDGFELATEEEKKDFLRPSEIADWQKRQRLVRGVSAASWGWAFVM